MQPQMYRAWKNGKSIGVWGASAIWSIASAIRTTTLVVEPLDDWFGWRVSEEEDRAESDYFLGNAKPIQDLFVTRYPSFGKVGL